MAAQSGRSAAARPDEGLRFTRHARAIQPGELVVVTIIAPAGIDTVEASIFGRELRPFRVDDRTWRTLVGIDLDTRPGSYPLVARAHRAGFVVAQAHTLTVTPKRFATRRLTVDDRYVEPPAEVIARIQEETALLAALWEASVPERLWTGAFARPVPDPANSVFGSRSVFNGQPRSPHAGADFRSGAGTAVRAPNAGRVVLARDLYFSGHTVVIDHGLGLLSLFAHLSRIDVVVDAPVAAGQVIGLVGATGRVTGAHLHWAVRLNGARVDPLSLLALLGEGAAN